MTFSNPSWTNNSLQDYLKEGIAKTAAIKSIKSLKYMLEKGLVPGLSIFGGAFYKTLDKHKMELMNFLNEEDFIKLRSIQFSVPKEGTILFLPKFSRPLLALNLNNLPNFNSPGWLFHALPSNNLQMVSKSGFLSAPLETILEKKQRFSTKSGDSGMRIINGISFAFQDYTEYLFYILREKARPGGFFIFPLKNVLNGEDLILDFRDTMDGWPEIKLIKKQYSGSFPTASLMSDCLDSIKSYELMEKDFDELLFRFKEMQEEYKKSGNLNIFFRNKILSKEIGAYNIGFITEYIKQNNFLYFLYFFSLKNFGNPQDFLFIPPIARFSADTAPKYLQGTIFKIGLDYFDELKSSNNRNGSWIYNFLILGLKKKQSSLFLSRVSYSFQDYLNYAKTMNPKDILSLIKYTRVELIKAIDIIIKQKFGSSPFCKVPANKGVLFLNRKYDDWSTLHTLTKLGVPIFYGFNIGATGDSIANGAFMPSEIDFFMKNVLKLNNLNNARELFNSGSYFYKKGHSVFVHKRLPPLQNSDFLIG